MDPKIVIMFAFCIGIPSSILYIYLAITILCRKDYRTTFYGFFVVRSIPDLLFFLDSTLCYRLPTLGLFPGFFLWLSKPVLAVIFYGTPIFFHADNLATMFMLLNRLTSVAWPIAHRTIWKVLFPICTLLTYSVPIISIAFIFDSNISATVETDANGTTTISINPDRGYENRIYEGAAQQDTFSAFVFMGISLCLNFSLLIAYIRAKKTNTKRQETAAKEAKKRMLIYTVITFLGHALIAANFIVVLILSSLPDLTPLYAWFSHSTWIIDSSCVALPSYLLLWASVKIRAQLVKDLKRIFPFLPLQIPGTRQTRVQVLSSSLGMHTTTMMDVKERH